MAGRGSCRSCWPSCVLAVWFVVARQPRFGVARHARVLGGYALRAVASVAPSCSARRCSRATPMPDRRCRARPVLFGPILYALRPGPPGPWPAVPGLLRKPHASRARNCPGLVPLAAIDDRRWSGLSASLYWLAVGLVAPGGTMTGRPPLIARRRRADRGRPCYDPRGRRRRDGSTRGIAMSPTLAVYPRQPVVLSVLVAWAYLATVGMRGWLAGERPDRGLATGHGRWRSSSSSRSVLRQRRRPARRPGRRPCSGCTAWRSPSRIAWMSPAGRVPGGPASPRGGDASDDESESATTPDRSAARRPGCAAS